MQNFEEAFLNMKPVIDDEIYVDLEQNQEQGQTDLERIRSGDPLATHSQPRISPDYSPDNDVDVFEGYSFNDRHSIVTVEEEGVPGKEEPEGAGQDGEFDPEKVLGSNDLTQWTIPISEALQSPTPPILRRLPEPPPTHTNVDMVPLPNAALLAIPNIPTQVPASPPTLPTDGGAIAAPAAFAHHHRRDQHQSFKPKLLHPRANVIRTRQKKTVVPVSEPDHLLTDDHNEEDVDTSNCEDGFDNCSWNSVNVDHDSGNHNGPGSTKTVSYHLLSMSAPDTRLTKRQSAVKIFIFDDDTELSQSEDCC
jgi:hypothetical protein